MSTSCVIDGGGLLFFSSFPLHALVLSLNFHLSAHLQGWCVCHGTTLIPFSLSQRDAPHAEPASGWRRGVLSGVSVHLSVGSRGVSSCVCAASCVSALGVCARS